ncbi:ribose-phosphate diphosphokinase [Candidatus Micrarchaeota archaeon]|nr:ribose-phosphate diphosphokinase [Candidatus Micrarchaeota archaeon]
MDRVVLSSPNAEDLGLGSLIEIKTFPDTENYIRITEDCEKKDVVLIHRCYPNQDKSLVQLFLALRQIKEMKARSVSVVVPYLPYARQDKRFLDGEAMSSETICSLLNLLGCKNLITFDCHFLKKTGEFTYAGLRITNKTMSGEIINYLKSKSKKAVVISPDEGAKYLVEKDKGLSMKKIRGRYNDSVERYREIESMSLGHDISNKDVIIIDDMISTGSTIIKAAQACKEAGAANVYCAATHGLFLNSSLSRLHALGVKEVVVTNTIHSPVSKIDISNVIKELV